MELLKEHIKHAENKAWSSYSISSINLYNFRSYRELKLQTDSRSVVLTGHNGAGKTNILEAISLLTSGKGLRGANLEELDNINTKDFPWTINASVENGSETKIIGTTKFTDSEQRVKRIAKVDHELVRNLSELDSIFSVIYLIPQMDHVFSSGSASRRDFLDQLTSLFDPEHTKHLTAYQKYLRERKKLLKTRKFDNKWLSAVEHTIAENGVIIAAARKNALNAIQKSITESNSPFIKASCQIKGFLEDRLEDSSALTVENLFREKLEASREIDLLSGKTTYGPHRSDLRVLHSENLKSADFCSTGEQKSLLLSVVLGAASARAIWTGVAPVLLLDEIIAHFDEKVREYLLLEIMRLGLQAWMTATDPSFFENFRQKMQFFTVKNSTICY